jgi:hypothetical protein
MKIIRIAVAVTALLILLVPSWGMAQVTAEAPVAPAKVAFVQMHMDSSGITMVKVQVVNGTTKAPSKDPNRPGLLAEMRLADSTVLVVGHIADPLRQRLEYEDPAEPGKLKAKMIEKSSADFLVRVPIRDDMVRLDFYRIEAAPEGAGKAVRKLLGSFTRFDLQESK